MDYSHLITIEPGKRSGQPCIRGMRITVRDVLEYLAGGMTVPELLGDFPELTEDDIRACLAYAASLLPRPAAWLCCSTRTCPGSSRRCWRRSSRGPSRCCW